MSLSQGTRIPGDYCIGEEQDRAGGVDASWPIVVLDGDLVAEPTSITITPPHTDVVV
ncbi:MAG: hypothetical protein M3460_20695 [Actinomycetota bacterium]|nr:hypothetical protein [Actinomycetota bacterium]